MADAPQDTWIDELERDLGQGAALRLLAAAGGQRRTIPRRAVGSRLADEVDLATVEWLSARFGGTDIDVPSHRGREIQDRAAQLRATIFEAGLTEPRLSANVIAVRHGVTSAYVRKLRAQMRVEYGVQPLLPMFDDDQNMDAPPIHHPRPLRR